MRSIVSKIKQVKDKQTIMLEHSLKHIKQKQTYIHVCVYLYTCICGNLLYSYICISTDRLHALKSLAV